MAPQQKNPLINTAVAFAEHIVVCVRTQSCSIHTTNQAVAKLGTVPGAQ